MGAGLDATASFLCSSSVRKGLMFCGLMARERVRENPVHISAGFEGGSTGGNRCTERNRENNMYRPIYKHKL